MGDLAKTWNKGEGTNAGKGIQFLLCASSGDEIRVRVQTYKTDHVGAQVTAGSSTHPEVQKSDCLTATQEAAVSVHVQLDLSSGTWSAGYSTGYNAFELLSGKGTSGLKDVTTLK